MKQPILFSIFVLISITLSAQIPDTIQIQELEIQGRAISDYKVIRLEEKNESTKSTGELLLQIPGVSITKRSSFSIEPSINSFKYDQINTSINGGMTASNSCPNRMDPVTTRISPDEIFKIEVVRGPYEVRYGQIMGGFINLISHERPNCENFTLTGNIASEYEFNGNGKNTSANIKGGNKKFDVKFATNYHKYDNYTSGDDTEISSAYETYGINSGVGFNFSDKQRVYFNYMYSKASDVLHAGLPMDAKYDISNMLSLDYEFTNIGKIVSSFKMKLFMANEDHLMTNEYRPNASVSLANTPVISNDIGGRFIFTLNPVNNGIMNFGVDFKQISKEGNKEVLQFVNPCTSPPTIFDSPNEKVFEVWQNSYSQDIGSFVDFKYYFSSKLSTKTGLRTNFIKSDIKEPEQDFIDLYNNNIKPDNILNINYYSQVKYNLPQNFDLEISAGHGTRNPNLLEQYINHFTIGLDAYEYVGNPHLKSETNNQFNLMLSRKSKSLYTYIDFFYSRVDNYITAVVDTTIPRKFLACKEPKNVKHFVNIDEAQQYGVNFGARAIFLSHFTANIDLSYIFAENMDLDEPLPEIAPFTSIISLVYKNENLQINLEKEYQAIQTRISTLTGESKSEAFTIFNLSTSYLFFDQLNMGLALDNIFDSNYYRHLSRPYKNMDTRSMFYEPGRNFRLFFKYRF